MGRAFQSLGLMAILMLGVATQAFGQGGAPVTAATAQRLDALFAAWDNTRSPGCGLGVARNGNLVYSRSYGMSNLEYDIAITPDSIFHVASISKQFTAFAIALLASEGKLGLDDEVRRHVAELPDYGHRITIRHLLVHTSGLRDQWSLLSLAGWRPDDLITEDDVLRIVVRQQSLNFVPGVEYLYSNTGFTLLAVIVKRVSAQSLREFAETRIFGPLGMRDTHFHDDHTMIVRGRTSAYQPRPEGGWKISIPVFDTYGATSLFTTVGDLMKWEQNLFDARVGGRAVVDQMQISARLNDGTATDYGFGLTVNQYRGLRTIGHSGSDAGYRADVVRFPDQDLAVAALCNLSTITPGVLTRKAAEVILGSDPFTTPPPPISMAQTEMTALAGAYWNPVTDDIVRITVKDGQLMSGTNQLAPLGAGRFRVGEQQTTYLFPPSTAGAPQKLHTSPPATAGFTRVTPPPDPGDLRRYVGEYRSDELDVSYSVVLLPEGRLAVSHRKFDLRPLDMVKLDTFSGFGTVTFARAPSGDVTGFTVSTGRVRRLRFARVGATSSAGK